MEKKLVNYTFLVTLPLKKNEKINLEKLYTLCKEGGMDVRYDPHTRGTLFGVIVSIKPYSLLIFSSGKVSILGHYSINEEELDVILNELWKKNVKKSLFFQ